MNLEDVLDAAALSKALGIKRESVYRYLNRGSIPEPDAYVGRSPLWHKSTVERFLRERRNK